jgi:hypothetical protein
VLLALPNPEYSFIQCRPHEAIIKTAINAVAKAASATKLVFGAQLVSWDICRTLALNMPETYASTSHPTKAKIPII